MATNILGVSVPDSPLGRNEMCHEFTFNYIFQTIFINTGLIVPYYQYANYHILYHFLFRIGKRYFAPGVPIQRGDILIFSTSPTNIIGNNIMANNPITHSMVAINVNHWVGANNAGTFNLFPLVNQQIRLAGRSGIRNIGALGAYDPITGIFNNGSAQSIHIFR